MSAPPPTPLGYARATPVVDEARIEMESGRAVLILPPPSAGCGLVLVGVSCGALISCVLLVGYLFSVFSHPVGLLIIAGLASMTTPFVLSTAWATFLLVRRPRLVRRIEVTPDRLVHVKGGVWRNRRREWAVSRSTPWRIDRRTGNPRLGYLFGLRIGTFTEYFYDRRPDFGDRVAAAFGQVLQSHLTERRPSG